MAKKAPTPAPSGPRVRAENDIFTVYLGISLFIVLGTVAFVVYRCNELLGKPFPGF